MSAVLTRLWQDAQAYCARDRWRWDHVSDRELNKQQSGLELTDDVRWSYFNENDDSSVVNCLVFDGKSSEDIETLANLDMSGPISRPPNRFSHCQRGKVPRPTLSLQNFNLCPWIC